jgi:hypothetical protein
MQFYDELLKLIQYFLESWNKRRLQEKIIGSVFPNDNTGIVFIWDEEMTGSFQLV